MKTKLIIDFKNGARWEYPNNLEWCSGAFGKLKSSLTNPKNDFFSFDGKGEDSCIRLSEICAIRLKKSDDND